MRELLLKKLMDNQHSYVSGEEISKELNVSRTAIWKHIKELKKRGYEISSASNKGYMLTSTADVLSKATIKSGLETMLLGNEIEIHESIDSTTSRAKILALEECADGTVVIAGEQTAGRGRIGRSWDSASGKGLWMSVVLKSDIAPELAGVVTLGVSLAVVRALSKNLMGEFKIKWPNDIIYNGKKLCGILCEMSAEADRINHIVVGIGLNISHDVGDFPEELQDKATSIKLCDTDSIEKGQSGNTPKIINRAFWASQILNELERVYFILRDEKGYDIITQWKEHSLTLSSEVKVTYREEVFVGIAKDVTELGELVVETSTGELKIIRSGEAQVRGVLGYLN